MDLHLLVHQMTTDKFAWNTVDILCSRKAIDLVGEAKAQSVAVAAAKSEAEGAAKSGVGEGGMGEEEEEVEGWE